MGNNKRDIIINLISNTIFQVILTIVSGSGIAYTIKTSVASMSNETLNISPLELCIFAVSCIVITVCIVSLLSKVWRYIKAKDEEKQFDDVDDYYFTDYEKHITIYKNGNGIIIHRFTVVVNNVDKFRRIRRKLNIEDGNIHSVFPPLDKMMRTVKSERFDKFGFWYYDESDIIADVKEYYWQRNSEEESKKAKGNNKELRWIFKIDRHKVQKNVPYNIVYTISVPGLAPLEDGRLNRMLLADEFGDESYSSMNIDHKIQNFRYIISFEEGIELDTEPDCRYIIGIQDESKDAIIAGEKTYDIFYNKYIFNINAPEFNSDVKVKWKYSKIGAV